MKGWNNMYCSNCNKTFNDGSRFCTSCGKLLENEPEVKEASVQPEAVISEQADIPAAEATGAVTEPAAEAENTAAESFEAEKTIVPITEQPRQETAAQFIQPQPPVTAYVPPVPEKTDFGKGALAFCLVVIGLLAISTGVFASLYFSVI